MLNFKQIKKAAREVNKMSFDYSKLRGKIVEKYGNQSNFASALGISENTLSLKMNNKVRFTTDDITTISRLLEIDAGEIGRYFFALKV